MSLIKIETYARDYYEKTRAIPIIGDTVAVLDHGFVRYLDHLGSDHEICAAARVSYAKGDATKTPEDDQRLINRLYKDKHTSPFEMVKVVFNIKMPIFVMRQYVRHRMQNLNEVSARYTELPNEFYIPTEWRLQDTKNKQGSSGLLSDDLNRITTGSVGEFCQDAYGMYQVMLNNGISREMARMVLPLNIYTEIRCCWDLKNLLHFITLREDSHAQSEIQEYAKAMKVFITKLFPMVMSAYEKYKFVCEEIQ